MLLASDFVLYDCPSYVPPSLTKPLKARDSIHSQFRQVDVPSAIQAHAVSTIQGRAATTRKSAFGIEHRKPRYLVTHEDHIFGLHNNCHGMENVPNIADELPIKIEELDSVVLSITDNQRAILGKREVVWRAEFARSRSGNTPAPDRATNSAPGRLCCMAGLSWPLPTRLGRLERLQI